MSLVARTLHGAVLGALLVALAGCVVPRSQLEAVRVQNRSLTEQNRAQLAEIENLKVHGRNTEDQLKRSEEELALVEDRVGLDDKQLANFRRERDELHKQFMGLVNNRGTAPGEIGGRLAEISQRYPALQFDPRSGVAKLDTDILFDSGKDELKPGAEKVLAEVAQVLGSPEAADLRVMVVGHTDDRQIVRTPGEEQFATNFDLSAARALAVAKKLRGAGIKPERMGVAGFGAHQPIAPNASAADRHKNRRVELFVLAPDVPVVGWTETMPTIY
jgi:chemotaxis protein MotB